MKEFMGQEVTTKETDAKDTHRVSKKGQHKIFADLGVTDEVRKSYENAQDKIIEKGLNAVAEEARKSKKRQELIVGTGNGSITCTVKEKQVSIDPKTKKPIVKYAVPGARVARKLSKGVKDKFAEEHAGLQKVFKS